MGFSCSDFTDAVITALNVDIPHELKDSPSDQADICLAEIERLQDKAKLIQPVPRFVLLITALGDGAEEAGDRVTHIRFYTREAAEIAAFNLSKNSSRYGTPSIMTNVMEDGPNG